MTRVGEALLEEILNDAALDRLAAALAPRIAALDAARAATVDGWLNAQQAADYLGCRPDRVYDLVQRRKLQPRRDGRRLLFRRLDLDAYLEGR